MERLILLQDRGRALRIATVPGPGGVYDFLEFSSAAEAKSFLSQHATAGAAMQSLRRALAEEGTAAEATRLSDDAVLDQLALRVQMRRVGIARELPRPLHDFTTLDEEAQQAQGQSTPATPPKEKKLTWIEIQVVDDASSEPMNWVRMTVRTPDGNQSFETTDSQGVIRIEALEPGTCDAWCDLKGATIKDTLCFVSLGTSASDAGDGQAAAPKPKPQAAATLRIAVVESHKVRTGESILSLATAAGMKWQDLAKFNFETDDPNQINDHLRKDVGCTKKTADGYNYMFDDSDQPGIMFIPKAWSEMGLPTGQRHVVRVRPLTKTAQFFLFSM